MSTDTAQFFAELSGGVFEEKLSSILSQVAVACCDRTKTGKVTIELNMKPIGNGHQVNIQHRLKYEKPTIRGKVSEDDTTETPMYVGTKGALSLFPEKQTDLFHSQQETTSNDHG